MTRRLTLLFILLLTGCAAVACAVQLWTSMQYGNAMVQRLSGGLAQHIAQRETLLDAQGQVDRTRLKPLFDRLMTFNPSVELYILSPDGQILADAAPPGHIKRQKLAVAPVQQFLSGGMMPVYGDDPRTLTGEKVFSAVPLHQDGVLRGYLYIILQGEELNALAEQAWQKNALEHGALVAAAGSPFRCAGGGAGLVLGHPAGEAVNRRGEWPRSGKYARYQAAGRPAPAGRPV
ncbi:Uncharacterised protein [Leclercia adecarboxylata]|uniref:Histidine kinase n=1 Tax=Leclercia adecarboxylata TaxID=83655 RepID=A0A4U9HQZ0_9ENTR|nr:Uncharacterised protein [Leclercia adecarboxylata]